MTRDIGSGHELFPHMERAHYVMMFFVLPSGAFHRAIRIKSTRTFNSFQFDIFLHFRFNDRELGIFLSFRILSDQIDSSNFLFV